MGASFERLGPRAPLSLTQLGAFQSSGVGYATGLLISSAELFAWRPVGLDRGEGDILRFIEAHAANCGDFLLLGTGAALAFPAPSFVAEIDRRGLGLEAMDTAAACRTYNVLVAEARRFTAALLPLGTTRTGGDS